MADDPLTLEDLRAARRAVEENSQPDLETARRFQAEMLAHMAKKLSGIGPSLGVEQTEPIEVGHRPFRVIFEGVPGQAPDYPPDD